MLRLFFRAVCVVLVILHICAVELCSAEAADIDSMAAFEALVRHRMDHAGNDAERDVAKGLLHQVRNHEIMSGLVSSLAGKERPGRIRYLASGSHMAPLALCELLPPQTLCSLVFSEIDAAAENGIVVFLDAAAEVHFVEKVKASERLNGGPGSRVWTFETGLRKVRLQLIVEAPGPLIRPGSLNDFDLVLSHDWSGDPMGNLVIIRDFILEVRSSGLEKPPLLMIEDLEAHPYPIDLTFFGPRGRASGPYGHRTSDAGIGRHGDVELGEGIFGGAALLGFGESWWSKIEMSHLQTFFDFLLFYRFDSQRQNVLEGGSDPLLAGTLLDWWTGFGTRSIRGPDIRSNWSFRRDMVTTVLRQAEVFSPSLKARVACALELYRSILQAKAKGEDVGPVMPDAIYKRRPVRGAFPSQQMEELYDEALKNVGLYRTDKEDEAVAALRALEQFETGYAHKVLALCSCRTDKETENESWADRYRAYEACLDR